MDYVSLFYMSPLHEGFCNCVDCRLEDEAWVWNAAFDSGAVAL